MSKIIFMGSPDFAIPALQNLIDSKYEIVACFTKAATQKNRGKKIIPTPVEQLAAKHNIPIYTPKTLRNADLQQQIKDLEADFIVVVAYGLLLPEEVLKSAKYEALNIHPSALPRFRGAAPLERTLMAGDKTTKICIMQMTKELDAGDVYLEQELKIPQQMNLQELHDQAAQIGAQLLIKTLDNFSDLKPKAQEEEGLCYAHKLDKSEFLLDFSKEPQQILNLIRALAPRPGAYFIYKDKRIKILQADFVLEAHNEEFGKVRAEDFAIFVNGGLIMPEIIKPEGKSSMSIADFLRGV